VDISQSGISAMLRKEVPLGEVVRLEFTRPLGDLELLAMVRQRSAFRYGFQFVEASSLQDIIGRTCRDLAARQSVPPAENTAASRASRSHVLGLTRPTQKI
jgi:hypothetical protein